VDPSSLVFLAIIGVWAAYLVPTWLRRRVHFAQARARDRFSASARVLHRRSRSGLGRPSTAAVLSSPAAVSADDVVDEVLPKHGARASRVGEADRARARSAQREAHIAHATSVERARLAAARRARVMVSLLLFSGVAWAVSLTTASPIWVSAPPSVMLLVHMMAARVAAVRSRRTLAVSRARLAETRRRAEATVAAPAPVVPEAPVAAPAADVEAPAAAVGDDTWVPVPVPPPTYTLKPVVPRPEPAPLPAALPPVAASGRGRGALPRRPEEIERILDLDAADDLETRRAVNG
jgi:hypothetical protein